MIALASAILFRNLLKRGAAPGRAGATPGTGVLKRALSRLEKLRCETLRRDMLAAPRLTPEANDAAVAAHRQEAAVLLLLRLVADSELNEATAECLSSKVVSAWMGQRLNRAGIHRRPTDYGELVELFAAQTGGGLSAYVCLPCSSWQNPVVKKGGTKKP